MPHHQMIVALLRDALAETGEDLEDIHLSLEKILAGEIEEDEEPLALPQIAALGFLGLIKAQRETGLMLEVAIREETRDLGDLTAELRAAASRIMDNLAHHRDEVEPKLELLLADE
jgi:hypothetical protein